jgi:hypothetical protein
MTQIATVVPPNITQGPRGIGARNAGGVYSQDAQQDIIDCDAFQSTLTLLSGTTDNVTPNQGFGGNYIIKTAGVDATTGIAPRAGLDDGLTISVYSDTANAHTITFSTNCIADGAAGAPHHIVTFAAFRGAGVQLRAFNGTWQVVGNTGCTIT